MNKNSQEKEKNKDTPIDETKKKSYRVPNANSKKNFEKINFYNFIGITKFFSFPEMLELAGVCHLFNQRIREKYPKRIPLIKTTLKILKKNINLNFSVSISHCVKYACATVVSESTIYR